MKTLEGCFSQAYGEARGKLRQAAESAGAELWSEALERRGPDGAELYTDVVWLGPRDAAHVLVTISATHGVEGFFGSAVQVEWLRRSRAEPLPPGFAALHVHAINPYGFAWLRRTNEDNVDLNRNWLDFDLPLPAAPLYDELAADLCPVDWTAASQADTGRRIGAWIQRHGAALYQQAVSGGQWHHPQGLFYGGTAPSWSRRTLTKILTASLRSAARVCVIDFHTGLGPYGYAEPIIGLPRDTPGYQRTRDWIGAGARSLFGDGAVSAEIKGDAMGMLPPLLPHAVVDVLALECGIRPIPEVAQALRADAWLHAHGDPLSAEATPIKAALRAAFHADDPLWQGMALGQGLTACRAAVRGMGFGNASPMSVHAAR
jgi:hypothetical protein